jgi:hypothetical protein
MKKLALAALAAATVFASVAPSEARHRHRVFFRVIAPAAVIPFNAPAGTRYVIADTPFYRWSPRTIVNGVLTMRVNEVGPLSVVVFR